jgi:thioredoxin-like negative regulator of GroEL
MALIELEAIATLGELEKMPQDLLASVQAPERWGPAIAAVAAGTRRRLGPAAAIGIVQSADRLNVLHPASAPALRGLVQDLAALDQQERALELVRAALEVEDAAVLSEILGEALVLADRPAEARPAFEHALELEPGRPRAVMGLASVLAANGDEKAALDVYAGLSEEALEDAAPLIAHAELLAAAGRKGEADARLVEALERDPYNGKAALELAKLRMPDGARDDVRRRLEQALLFGGGSEARELLSQFKDP